MHGDDRDAVTDKAERIIASSLAYPDPPADAMSHATREKHGGRDRRRRGRHAGRRRARADGSSCGLVERRPFLGGRAARIGTVFPTNDCGQCLPTTDAQAGTRKCFHRNVALDHPGLTISRRATVESVSGHPGDFRVSIGWLPNIVTEACVNCGACESVCPVDSSEPGMKAIFSEFYDGRVVRTIDLDTCTFCGKCVTACPVDAIDFSQSPERRDGPRLVRPRGHRLPACAGETLIGTSATATTASSPRSNSPR